MADSDVKVRITAEDATKNAFRQVEAGLKRLQLSAASVVGSLSTVGVGVAFAGLVSGVKSAIDELAALDDMAEQTGSSVETISAALNTLRANDAGGLPELSELANRFGRAMQQVDRDTSKSAEAFERLGINVDEFQKRGRIDQAIEFAKALERFADDGNKAILVESALGRGAASLISDLKELAKTTDDAATATGRQAQEAESVKKQLASLQAQFIALRNDIAVEVIPIINDFLIRLRAVQSVPSGVGDWVDAIFGDPASTSRRLAGTVDELSRLQSEQEKLIARRNDLLAKAKTGRGDSASDRAALPFGDLFGLDPNNQRTIETKINENNAKLQVLGQQRDKLQAIILEQDRLRKKYSAVQPEDARPQVSTAGLTGGDRPKAQTKPTEIREVEDYAARISKIVADALQDSDIVRAREYADAIAELDKLFFNFGLSADIYESAMRKITGATSSDRSKALERQNQELDEAAERWKDLIDPSRQYLRQLEEIERLAQSGRLNPEQRRAAEFGVQSRWQDELDAANKAINDVDKSAQDLGLTFQSAFEEAVLGGQELSKVLQGLGQDIARIILRRTVTEPLGNFVTEMLTGLFSIKPKADGGSVVGGEPYLVGELGPELMVPASAGTIVPNKSIGGGVTVVNHITVDSRSDRASIMQAMDTTLKATQASILDQRARGMAV
jgi:hypothetical protein